MNAPAKTAATRHSLTKRIKARALELGFDKVGIMPAATLSEERARLEEWAADLRTAGERRQAAAQLREVFEATRPGGGRAETARPGRRRTRQRRGPNHRF